MKTVETVIFCFQSLLLLFQKFKTYWWIEIPRLLSELSISGSQLDALTTCLSEVIWEKEIGKQKFIDL